MAYTGSVGHGLTEATVNATVSDSNASVEIIPEDADDETPGDQVNLAVGETWPWGRGSCNGTTCDAPLTRERARYPRLCGRPHPAAHIGARVGKSGAVASPSAGETGLDRP